MSTVEARSIADLERIESQVRMAAERTVKQLQGLLCERPPLAALAAMKFDMVGHHPIDERRLNLIEQLNQSFTYLASARGGIWLMKRYRAIGALRLNLGTTAGYDIESTDGTIVAETFAAVTPRNNRKLANDCKKVAGSRATHRYVFYISPSHQPGAAEQPAGVKGVKVVSLGWNDV